MTTQTLALAVAEGNALSNTLLLPSGQQPVYVNAAQAQRFILSDSENPQGPEKLRIRRRGSNLEIALPDEEMARLVVLDFYAQNATLEGIDSQGETHTYVSALDENIDASQLDNDERAFVLLSDSSNGSAPLVVPHDSGFWKAAGAFVALLALGGIIYTFHHNHHGKDQPPNPPIIDFADDSIGFYTGKVASGGLTDDASPLFSGTANPGNIITLYADGNLLGSVIADAEGNWQLTPELPLAHGHHAITATQTESIANGLVSQLSEPFMLEVDLIAPDRPALISVQDAVGDITGEVSSGQPTNDNRPLMSGSGEAGATLIILIDGVQVAEVVIDSNGQWQWQPPSALADGEHQFTAFVRDPAGNEGLPSSAFILNIDTVAPDAPAVATALDNVAGGVEAGNDIGNGGLTNDNRPVLKGSAEAHSMVHFYNAANAANAANALIGSVVADANGQWQWRPDSHLPEGTNTLTLTATDAAGNISDVSAKWMIEVDTLKPDAPAVTAALDNVAGGVEGGNDIGNGGLTNDGRPVLKGSAEAHSVVRFYDAKNALIGSVTADDSGQWQWRPEVKLPEGNNVLTLTATDAAGNISDASAKWVIEVDTLKPNAPAVTAALDNVAGGVEGGNDIGNGGLTNDGRPVLKGTAEAYSVVRFYDASNHVLGSIATGANGQWEWRPNVKLPEGTNTLSLTATDAAGNISDVSAKWVIEVDTLKPNAPAVTSVLDNVAGGVEGGNDIGNGGLTNDGRPVLNGSAEARSVVHFYNANNVLIGSVMADASGEWQWRPDSNLPEGTNTLTLTATDAAGNISDASAKWVVEVDTVKPNAPAVTAALDNVAGGIEGGNDIGNGGLTNDNRPVLKGSAEAYSVVRFYDATNTLIGSASAGANGQWEWRPDANLPEGASTLTLTATDAAGNISDASMPWVIDVDTIKPDNDGFTIGSVDSTALWAGNTTDDARPQLSGTGEKDALVIIYQNDNPVGSVVVNAQGHWNWRPANALVDGNYAFGVTLTDPAGNVSAATPVPVAIIVDATPPAATALIGAISHDDGFEGNGSDFVSHYTGTGRLISGTIRGVIASNERIQISSDNGLTWHDVERDPQGGWYWMDPLAHTSDWNIQTRVIDNLGRTTTVETQPVVLDSSAPDAPFEVSYVGQEVTVHFSGKGTEKDGHVSIKVGENYYLFAVSDADTAQGYITVTLPDTAVPDDDLTAAVVNRVGKVSDYRDVPQLKAIDFKTYAGGYDFAAGTVVDGVTFDTAGHFHQNDAFTAGTSQGWVLHFWGAASSLYLNKDELGTKHIEFNTRAFNGTGTLNIRFYDQNNELIDTWPAFSSNGSTIAHISYTSDVPIFRVEFNNSTGSGAISVMDFAIMRSYDHAPDTHFAIDENTEFMPGTDQADIFDVNDVADLSPLKALAGGLGIDTLRLLGADQTLDFTQFANKISSIEVIDITGSGNNTLNLSLGDILAQGQNDLFHTDGNVQMMIKGNSGDVVNLSDLLSNNADPGDWNQGGSVTVGGLSYQIWQHTGLDAELLVQDGVTVNAINH